MKNQIAARASFSVPAVQMITHSNERVTIKEKDHRLHWLVSNDVLEYQTMLDKISEESCSFVKGVFFYTE